MADSHIHDKLSTSCKHVIDEGKPILLVTHDFDDTWQFLCGDNNHYDYQDARSVCAGCIFEKDPSLEGIETLDIGYGAVREKAGSKSWVLEELVPDDDDEE